MGAGATHMRIAVAGLFHLGLVTAACLTQKGHDVIAFDPDKNLVADLHEGKLPIYEPGLKEALKQACVTNKLHFSNQLSDLTQANLIWITFDTPVNHDDSADLTPVLQSITAMFPYLKNNTVVVVSSQLPAGTCQKIQDLYNKSYPDNSITLAYIPENLRLGKSLAIFTQPDRIVIGLDNLNHKPLLEHLLLEFTDNLIWMSVISAELTKHAINAFLALSVTYINEIANLCEALGANAHDVERGLKSEERIGPKAYLHPGEAIAGGTLMRDIQYLTTLAKNHQCDTSLISAVVASNHYHKQWSCRKLVNILKNLKNKKIAVLGLTYKAGTNTLRRSASLETCEWLHSQGCSIVAFDPVIKELPAEFAACMQISLAAKNALVDADAVIISTAWPQFKDLAADDFVHTLKQPFILDPSGFMQHLLAHDKRLHYFSVGTPV
jgi:UDPglucose 6-dehydrogenase